MNGVGMAVSALPARLLALSGSVEASAWLASAFALSYVLLQLPGGWLADRFGVRVVLSLGFGLMALSGLCYALAEGANALFLGRFIQGAGEAPVWAAAPALLSRLDDSSKGRFIGLYGAAFQFGLTTGPLAGMLPALSPFWTFAGLCAFCGLAVVALVREPARGDSSLNKGKGGDASAQTNAGKEELRTGAANGGMKLRNGIRATGVELRREAETTGAELQQGSGALDVELQDEAGTAGLVLRNRAGGGEPRTGTRNGEGEFRKETDSAGLEATNLAAGRRGPSPLPLATALAGGGYGLMVSSVPAFLLAGMSFSERGIGLCFALTFLAFGAAQFLAGTLSDRWGRRGFILAGLILAGLGLGVFALFGPGFALGALAVAGLGLGTFCAASLAAQCEAVAPERRAKASGRYFLAWGVGYFAIPQLARAESMNSGGPLLGGLILATALWLALAERGRD